MTERSWIDRFVGPAAADPTDERDQPLDRARLTERLRAERPLLPLADVARTVTAAINTAEGLGPIGSLLQHHDVDEIMINGPGSVWVERAGLIERTDLTLSRYDIDLLVERIVTPLGLRVDRTSPIVDARLADGARVNVVVPPLAVDGPAVTIRRFGPRPIGADAFGPAAMVGVLGKLIAARASVLVVGGTGSGKTTLINAIGSMIPPDERVVSIEDTAELRLTLPNLVRLEGRPANSEGVGGVELRRLVLTALRMRPDRIVIGEVRGAEAFDLLLALTSGHHGSLTSCHADDAAAGLQRLEVLASLAGADVGPGVLRQLVGAAIDAVIHVERVGPTRVVRTIAAVGEPPTGRGAMHRLQPLWTDDAVTAATPATVTRRAA